jgi:TolB protein
LRGTAVAIVALACGALAASAPASFPGRPGKIAFSWAAPGAKRYRIQAMRPNGRGRLAAVFATTVGDTLVQGGPTYSADGREIAFNLEGDIYVVNSDGSGLRQVTSGPEKDRGPSFSPTGTSLVFSRSGVGASDIYTVDLDGSDLTQLTGAAGANYDPTWSPNGRLIAFVSNRSGSSHVWLMRADGSGQRILVADRPHRADGQVQPEFAPNSHRIVVSRGAHLVTMRLDGSHRHVLNTSSILSEPTYSPDGRTIAAIQTFRGGGHRYSIVAMNASNGSQRHTIRGHIPWIFGISWQPLPRR